MLTIRQIKKTSVWCCKPNNPLAAFGKGFSHDFNTLLCRRSPLYNCQACMDGIPNLTCPHNFQMLIVSKKHLSLVSSGSNPEKLQSPACTVASRFRVTGDLLYCDVHGLSRGSSWLLCDVHGSSRLFHGPIFYQKLLCSPVHELHTFIFFNIIREAFKRRQNSQPKNFISLSHNFTWSTCIVEAEFSERNVHTHSHCESSIPGKGILAPPCV